MPKVKKRKSAKVVKSRKAARKTTARKKTPKRVAKKKLHHQQKGYGTITAYLIVQDATKAIDFYRHVFAAKEVMRMEQPDGKIGHAELVMGDSKIMLADECPEMNAKAPNAFGGSPVMMHLYTKNVDATVDTAVSKGAKLVKPIENMFYGDRSGVITDPFGHTWSISTHVENVTPKELKKRAMKLYE